MSDTGTHSSGKRGQLKVYEIVGSGILELETERMCDENKKRRVKELYQIADIHAAYTDEIKKVTRDNENIKNPHI